MYWIDHYTRQFKKKMQGWVCSTMKIGTISYICMFLPVLSKIHKESFKLQEFHFDQVLKIPASKFILQQFLKINEIKHYIGSGTRIRKMFFSAILPRCNALCMCKVRKRKQPYVGWLVATQRGVRWYHAILESRATTTAAAAPPLPPSPPPCRRQ